MRRGEFTGSQVVATFKQVEAGRQIKDICHELGVTNATYYVWKSKCGGMDALERLAAAILVEAMQAPLKFLPGQTNPTTLFPRSVSYDKA